MDQRTTTRADRPVVALLADVQKVGDQNRHTIDFVPVDAVTRVVDAAPLIIPALGEDCLEDVLARVDGLVVAGGLTNVHPSLYGRAPAPEDEPFDRARDATAIPLIRLALARGVPTLLICRGLQELNIAFGGTLRTEPKDLPVERKHGNPKPGASEDEQYGIRQGLNIVPGGQFDDIIGARRIQVNSVHSQVVDRLGRGLVVEAMADDGTVEAVSVAGAESFALGVVFHPDYWADSDAPSRAILLAFREAVERRAALTSEHADV
jgi:putative glutamine amidotransferase